MLLYGSAAKESFGRHSDVDIAVAGSTALDRVLLYSTRAELSVLLGREIDLIDLYRAEGLILYKVMTGSKRVKLDAALFVKNKRKALRYKEDFKPIQDKLRNARIRRFVYGS